MIAPPAPSQESQNYSWMAQAFYNLPANAALVEVSESDIRHIYVSRETEILLNETPGGANGKYLHKDYKFDQESISHWRKLYTESARLNAPAESSYYFNRDGKIKHITIKVVYLGKNFQGNDIGFYYGEDVTERKLLLDQLHAEKDRFQLAIDGANAGLWDWNITTGEVYYSKKWKTMLGYEESEIPSTLDSWSNLLHPEDKDSCLERLKSYLAKKLPEFMLEHRLRCKDGSYRWILSKGSGLWDGAGKAIRLTGWHIDIHELKSSIEELQKRDKIIQEQQFQIVAAAKMSSLGEMAGGIAHEINNPLAIIDLSANQICDTLERNPKDLALIQESANSIKNTVKRISRIVKGLRTFARSGENDPFKPYPLENLVTETLDLCRERFRQSEIKLSSTPIPSMNLNCRAVQISQVLLNLLNNSFDAVKNLEKKWVHLEVKHIQDRIRFSVSDSGAPISPDVIPKIMDPFFTTKEIGQGMGLGLSISKGIVEAHRGTLNLEPGTPTCFWFEIPLHR